MRLFFSLALIGLFTTLSAQDATIIPAPYNPDLDGDGLITVSDVLGVISVFSDEFEPAAIPVTNLSGIYLYNSNLFQANLTYANLSFAQCHDTDFSDANLSNANLFYTSFYSCNLYGVTWTGAYIAGCTGCDCIDSDGDNYCD